MQSWFYDVSEYLDSLLSEGEQVTVSFAGEVTGFARISSGCVRQGGSIEQRELTISLRKDGREIQSSVMLSGSLQTDRDALRAIVDRLSSAVTDLPVDPHLADFPESAIEEQRGRGRIPGPEELIDAIALVGPAGRIRERLAVWKDAAKEGKVSTLLLSGGGSGDALRFMAEEVL